MLFDQGAANKREAILTVPSTTLGKQRREATSERLIMLTSPFS
jgi:hypothetical protein